MTTDSGTNKIKALRLNEWPHLQCSGHRLHNAIESPTSWGSRQQMIERVLEQEKAIAWVLESDKKTRHLVPTWQDTDMLESVDKAVPTERIQ
ncbi:hypothetical protein LDENG_00179050 [Lucifuga dentata]|nr:hypothetical protein LDENG_00179050 [Lucifuga dentata]